MNEQVKNYFLNLKLKLWNELEEFANFRENFKQTIYIESVGDGFQFDLDDDDLTWVRYIQHKYLIQNPKATMPGSERVIAVRYALLHPLPLNRYVKKWDEKDQDWIIYKKRTIGGGKKLEEVDPVIVGSDLRELYNYSHPSSQVDKDKKDKETDGKIADWWMEESKNYLFARKNKNDDYHEVPTAFANIISNAPNDLIIGFRHKNNGDWKYVGDKNRESKDKNHKNKVGINLKPMLIKLNRGGFDIKRHLDALTFYNTWDYKMGMKTTGFDKDVLDFGNTDKKAERDRTIKINVGDQEEIVKLGKTVGKKFQPQKIGYKTYKPMSKKEILQTRLNKGLEVRDIDRKNYDKSIFPGRNKSFIDNTSETFNKIYNDYRNIKFIDFIHSSCVKSVSTSISTATGGSVKANIKFDKYGDHKVSVSGQDNRLNEETIREIVQHTLVLFVSQTSEIQDDLWQNWKTEFEQNESNLKDTIYKIMLKSANKAVKSNFEELEERGVGGSDEEKVSPIDAAAASGESDAARMKEIDPALITLLSKLKDDKFLETKPENFGTALKTAAKTNKDLEYLIHRYNIDLDAVDRRQQELLNSDDDDDSQATFDKYQKNPSAVLANHESTDFQKFIAQRIMLDEMGVVWGNDKSSAKKLKPGQTLKGGIQVFGAPWAVGQKYKT